MNFTKIFAIFIGLFVLLIAANASTSIDLGPTNPNLTQPQITVSLEDDVIYVQDDETITLEFDIENTGAVKGNVLMQFDTSDEDYEDYFTVTPLSNDEEVAANDTGKIKFKVHIDNIPDDEYDLYFKVFLSYKDTSGNIIDLDEGEISATLNVDDFEDIDVELENDVICADAEYPVMTYLVFTNDTSDRYFIDPEVKNNESLWPKVVSDKIEIFEDEETRVPIYFRKEAPLGQYQIKIDQKIYEDSPNSENTRVFKKTLDVFVENCSTYNTSFYINPTTQNMNTNDRVSFEYNLYNEYASNTSVHFSGYTNDPSMSVVFTNDTGYMSTSYTGTFAVVTSSNTTPGIKTVTIIAETPTKSYSKTVQVNVLKADLTITANSVDIPTGIKGRQEIQIQNNTGSKVQLILFAESQGQDIVVLENASANIEAGKTATVYADIAPRSIGTKNYTLKVSGSITKQVLLSYTSSAEAGIINYISNYSGKANAINNVWSTIPVVLTNPYNFPTTLRLRLLSTDAITSKTSTITLEARQTKTVNVQFIVNTNEKKLKGTLEVASDVTNNTYPVYILVSPDTSFTNALELAEDVTTVPFTNGESSFTLKVYNPNGFSIKNATVKMLNQDGNVIGMKTFSIIANATKDVEVKFTLDSIEETSGSIVLNANDSENVYDVVYTKAGFLATGLFNLGLGGTISILLGAIIIILLIVYFSVRNPSLPEVQ